MEQTALRPKPMPGQERGAGERPAPAARRPHAARRRGGRAASLLFGLFAGLVLVLSGVGLGTVGATVIGMSRLAAVQKQDAAAERPRAATGAPGRPGATPAPPAGRTATASGSGAPIAPGRSSGTSGRAALGVEAVDASRGQGALLVAVHLPGPGSTAGLARGDVLFAVGGSRIASAAGLARAVAAAEPGRGLTLGVRHPDGSSGHVTAVPGVVT